jgi:MOSC domain-containing protein YiiM
MKLAALSIGQPRTVETPRGDVLTSIFKTPVQGPRKVVRHNVDGDRQSDLTVHGGPQKAVYAYAAEHYSFWHHALPESEIGFGAFGENLTVEGLLESAVHIGDLVEIGSARLRVTEPRMPCFKLALRFDRPDMVKLFWKSGRSGVYFSVEQEGIIEAGDEMRILEHDAGQVSVADVLNLYQGKSRDAGLYARFLATAIPEGWKEGVQERWERP